MVDGYYSKQGMLYKTGENEERQTQIYQVNQKAASLIGANKKARDEADRIFTGCYHHHCCDSWFWFNMYLLTAPPPPPGGGCGGCGGCGGANGEGVVILALIASIFAAAVSFFFTAKQGLKAEETRKKIHEVKELQDDAISKDVKDTYDAMLPILQEKFLDRSLKTTFTATLTVGFGLLTTALVLYLMHSLPFPPPLETLALAGGAAVGAGIIGHTIRPLVNWAREEALQKKYLSLINAVKNLQNKMVHPYEILNSLKEEKAYIIVNGTIFTKDATQDKYNPTFAYIQRHTETMRLNLQNTGYAFKQIAGNGVLEV
jgi:hypothetical protein